MQIKYLKENEIINLENGKRFTLNNTGKLFFDKYNELGFEIAYKEISALYNIDEIVIKSDLRKFIDQIEECDVHIDGSLPFRNYVVLEPTNDCSANCVHCFHKNSNKYSWNKNQIDKYLDLLQENGINAVSLTGGEIFSPHYIENSKYIIDELNRRGIALSTISTNGMFLTTDLFDWIMCNIDTQKTVFRISLDLIAENDIYKLRPGYKHYFKNDFWKSLNSNGINVVVTTVLTNQSPQEIVNVAELIANQNCVRKWIVKPLVPTKIGHYKLMNWDMIFSTYEAFLNWYKKNLDIVKYDFILGNVITKSLLVTGDRPVEYSLNEHPCKDEMFQKTIKANGKLTRCPMLPEINERFQGDDIVLSDNISYIFDDLVVKDMTCERCKYRKLCGGGCRAYAIAFSSNEKKCDISSKKMYNWILEDTYIYEEWPDYYYKIKELVCDD